MIELGAALCVFLALGSAGILLFGSRPRPESTDDRMRALRPTEPRDDDVVGLPANTRSRGALRRRLASIGWAERTATDLRRADIRLRVGEYLLVRVLCAVVLAAVVLLLMPPVVDVAFAIAGAVAGFFAPAFYVGYMRNKRLARIEQQLVDFLPSLASSLRSGFAFMPAVESAARQTSPPLGDEVALLLHDMSLGADSASALRALGDRVGSRDLEMVLTAVHVQRTTGGNLPEILDAASAALRDRERIRGEVLTFTAQQRMTGLILSVYPIAVGLLLLAIMPGMWSKLFTEPAGQVQLAIALGLQVIGFVAIRRALRVEV